MIVKQYAKAGSTERGDALVEIFPVEYGIDLNVKSSVYAQYGESIRNLALRVIKEYGISSVKMVIEDNSALEFAILSRIETAIIRSLRT